MGAQNSHFSNSSLPQQNCIQPRGAVLLIQAFLCRAGTAVTLFSRSSFFSFVCGVLAVLQLPRNLPCTDVMLVFLHWSQQAWGSAHRIIQTNTQLNRQIPARGRDLSKWILNPFTPPPCLLTFGCSAHLGRHIVLWPLKIQFSDKWLLLCPLKWLLYIDFISDPESWMTKSLSGNYSTLKHQLSEMHHLTFWEIATVILLKNTSHRILQAVPLDRLKSLLQVYWAFWFALCYTNS